MTWENVYTLISNGLFPILACIALAWFFNKVNENYRNDIKELSKTQNSEIDAINKSVNELTLAIQKLTDYMQTKGV